MRKACCLMSLSAGEPSAAGIGLITIGMLSGQTVFAAFGGSFIGAGISIAFLQSPMLTHMSRIKRFLSAALAAPLITLGIVENFMPSAGTWTVSALAMLLAFIAWKALTVLNNRSAKIADAALDKALSKTLGIEAHDKSTSMDSEYVDSGRASRWRVGHELDPRDSETPNKEN